jgi:hypothetical protein
MYRRDYEQREKQKRLKNWAANCKRCHRDAHEPSPYMGMAFLDYAGDYRRIHYGYFGCSPESWRAVY